MIPIHGFLEGDSLGLLLFAEGSETIGELAAKLQQSARVRVAIAPRVVVHHQGRVLDPSLTVAQAKLEALDRIDVVVRDG